MYSIKQTQGINISPSEKEIENFIQGYLKKDFMFLNYSVNEQLNIINNHFNNKKQLISDSALVVDILKRMFIQKNQERSLLNPNFNLLNLNSPYYMKLREYDTFLGKKKIVNHGNDILRKMSNVNQGIAQASEQSTKSLIPPTHGQMITNGIYDIRKSLNNNQDIAQVSHKDKKKIQENISDEENNNDPLFSLMTDFFNQGLSFMKENKDQEASNCFTKIINLLDSLNPMPSKYEEFYIEVFYFKKAFYQEERLQNNDVLKSSLMNDYFNQGINLYEQGKYQKALNCFANIVNFCEAAGNIAKKYSTKTYEQYKNYEKALEYQSKCIKKLENISQYSTGKRDASHLISTQSVRDSSKKYIVDNVISFNNGNGRSI